MHLDVADGTQRLTLIGLVVATLTSGAMMEDCFRSAATVRAAVTLVVGLQSVVLDFKSCPELCVLG